MNPDNGCADLHLHTTHSDGYYEPADLINKVAALNLCAVAITDHDEISALDEAIEMGRAQGLEVLTGVELSVSFQGRDIHLLGYCFDRQDVDLGAYLQLFRDERVKRARRILEKLGAVGVELSLHDVMDKAGTGSVGRPHIANVMLEKGIVGSFQEAFDKYLGDNKPASVSKYKLDVNEAISLIESAGGICCVAHPGIHFNDRSLITLLRMGMQGIEAVHPKHNYEKTRFYQNLARNYGLIATGGSDFHGGIKGEDAIGRYLVRYDVVEQLKSRSRHSHTFS